LSDSFDTGVIDRAVNGVGEAFESFGRWLSASIDEGVIDRAVNGVGEAFEYFGRWLSATIDGGVIDRAVDGFGAVVAGIGRRMRLMQSGQFHHYALAMLLGAILILGLYLVAGGAG
jgi:NADH:ubiquinone oxidoreductase subunit 5 (subunit L)/multisubunit Na+/H+ antiporter MnhA subunit